VLVLVLWSGVEVKKTVNDMPNQREKSKKCVAAWLDGDLLEEWKEHCDQLGKTQTDRLVDLILCDLHGSIPRQSPLQTARGGQRV